MNRVFRGNHGGLVVNYLGLADQLKKALITYTESGGQGDPTQFLPLCVLASLRLCASCGF